MFIPCKPTPSLTNSEAVLAILKAGECAVAYVEALRARDQAQDELLVAYDLYKGVPEVVAGLRGCQEFYEHARFIERGTADWDAMMVATASQYETLQKAKAKVRRTHTKLLKVAAAI